MRKKKQNNKGFSLIELLVSIAIMSVVVVTVGVLMSTSSDTYRSVSVDTTLQSEAQMVANAISNLAVDAFEAESTGYTLSDPDLDSGENKYLILTDHTDHRRYVLARNTTNDKVFYFECAYDAGTDSYSDSLTNESLLGEHIEDFTVDTSRVVTKNLINFSLTYKKNKRNYKGDYQVFMRNRKYESASAVSGNTPDVTLRGLTLSPTLVYVVVKAGVPVSVEKRDAVNLITSAVADGAGSVDFTATTIYNGVATDDMKKSDWNLVGSDTDYFKLNPETPAGQYDKAFGETIALNFAAPAGKTFQQLNTYDFTLTASKEDRSKKANIHVRIVKDLNLAIASGATTWKDTYLSAPYNGIKAENVPDSNYGQVGKTMTISARLEQYNVTDGVTWKLEWCDATANADETSGSWTLCTDPSYAKLSNTSSIATTNTLTFGNSANLNSKKFRVTATSDFDPSFSDSILIGVVPEMNIGGGDGFHSRGFYVDLNEYFKLNDPQSGMKVAELVNVEVGSGGDNNDMKGAYKVTPDFKLFMDYGTFQYSYGQEDQYYKSRKLYLNVTFKYYREENGETKVQEFTVNNYAYELKPVEVSPVTSSVICLKKGDSTEVYTKIAYANLINKELVSIYTKQGSGNFSNNINITGNEDNDKYLRIVFDESGLGNVNKFVDTFKVDLSAKPGSGSLKTYPIDAITVRMALKDYYQIKKATESYYDYTVYIANVENTGVYIPGPNAKKVDNDSGLIGWPNTLNASGTTTVNGINTSGTVITAQVNKQGNNYFCSYNGNTYKYNKTLECWSQQ